MYNMNLKKKTHTHSRNNIFNYLGHNDEEKNRIHEYPMIKSVMNKRWMF